MTNQQHPITPPEDLLQQLRHNMGTWLDQITIAYQAGADQELKACCDAIYLREDQPLCGGTAEWLRAARRPQPRSLKEQALEALVSINSNFHVYGSDIETIRRALETLDD